VFNRKNTDIAKDLNCGISTVTAVTQMFKLVKAQDFEHIRAILKTDAGRIKQLKWAAAKLNVEIPEDVLNAKMKKPTETVPEETVIKELKTAPVIAEKNESLYFVKILEALNKQNELLEQLCDVVIPHWCADMKDNQNANCDIISSRLASAEKALECIKVNTRKRGM